MKKLVTVLLAFGFISTSFASEVRPLSAICSTESESVVLAFFPHDDMLQSGLVDVLVQADLGALGIETYLINDIRASSLENGSKTKIAFTDGDITLDVVIDNRTEMATLLVQDGHTEQMTCISRS